jgi:hypothetical protein
MDDPQQTQIPKMLTKEQSIELFLNKRKKNVIKSEKNIHFNLFDQGFEEYFEDNKFSDAILVLNGGDTKIKAHRILLCLSSNYFKRKFLKKSKEIEEG